MARRNSRFVNQKIIIGNKSIQAGDLTDSAKDELGADSAFVKTVDGLDGSKISANTINPTAIANQDQLVASTGALTTGGILTISRDGGNSFINFDSVDQFVGQDSSLTVTETPTGFEFLTKYPTTLPFITSSRITVNLQTPIQNQQDLLHFFNVNAGAEGDEIHSVQILDSATDGDYDYYLSDEGGNFHYLKLLDSIPYGDTRLTVADSNNEVFINNGQRFWRGIKGIRLADSALEFGDSDAATGIQTRNIGSRLRFRTRKSVPSSETGGAPASYKLDAPEGPLGVGVSNPVYSKVSPRFVYRVVKGTQAQGFVSGYTSGGDLPGVTNVIDKFPFATDANATDVGNLTGARRQAAGQSSTAFGYTSGGIVPPATFLNVIDKFPFATDANATDVGNLTVSRRGAAGQSSTVSGYTSGGQAPGTGSSNVIDKFPFATDANATDVGDLTVARIYLAGQSSTVSGYSSGGSGSSNRIDKFPFATDANATFVGDLTVGRIYIAGQSSTAFGYTSGGSAPPAKNVIDKFPFASDTNATDVGDLTVGRYLVAGQSSTAFGYTSGGQPTTNRIDKFPFASDANATDVGDLTVARQEVTGQQV